MLVRHRCLPLHNLLLAAACTVSCTTALSRDEQCSTAAAIDDALQMAVITSDAQPSPTHDACPVITIMFFS
jgi:hypothetical protein